MSVKDAIEILENFPPGYIFVVFIVGLIVVLFSPFVFLFPNWIANPFISGDPVTTSIDVLSRLAVLLLTAFVFGIPLSLSENLMCRVRV